MFWLHRPPYLRWAAAAAIVLLAFIWELRSVAEAPHPFASRPIAAGAAITDEDVEWKPVRVGVLAMPDLSSPVASQDIGEGEPILPSAVSATAPIPDGWWSVPVGLPESAQLGARVRLIGTETPLDVVGVVVSGGTDDLLSFSDAGLVAVPPEIAIDVATAAVNGTLVVLLEP